MPNWRERLAEAREKSEMKVTKVPLHKVGEPWAVLQNLVGAIMSLVRGDGKFFSIVGAIIGNAKREVKEWGQPMLQENGIGAYVLVTDPSRSLYIVAMKQEPGNPAGKQHILLACPLQASLDNMQAAHGGTPAPRAEFYNVFHPELADAWKDGGRFIESMNKVGVTTLPIGHFETIKLRENELLITRAELLEAYRAGECNCYLREAIGFALLI